VGFLIIKEKKPFPITFKLGSFLLVVIYIPRNKSPLKLEMGKPILRPRNIMSQSTYKSIVLAKRPKSVIVPGETFNLKENPIVTEADLKDGQVLLETLYLSLDPAMRGWLNGNHYLAMHIPRDLYTDFQP
jgi:hypothetical protein